MTSRVLAGLFAVLCLCGPASAEDPAQRSDPQGVRRDLSSLEMEQLLDLKVTTASKFAEKMFDAPGVISVVTSDELDRFGAITLAQVFERVPGLSATSAYFTDRSIVAARGDQTKINGGHILFLINGRPTREVLEGGLVTDLLESFPIIVLERIEVIRGPGSVLYGSNAFTAVVNLITRKADGNGMVVTAAGGAPGGVAASARTMFKRGDLSIVGAAQFHQEPEWTTTYRYRAPLTDDLSVRTPSILQGGTGAWLGADYKGLSVMSSFTASESSAFARGFVGPTRWKRGFGDLGYRLKARDKWDMRFNLTYTRNTLDASSFEAAAVTRDSSELVLEWSNVVEFTDRDQLTFGALYNRVQGAETFVGVTPAIAISDGSRSGGSAYAQLQHRLLHSVALIGGLQSNKIGSLALNVVPRAGIIWNPASRWNVKILYSGAYRAPSINELLLDHPVLKGNPDLKPERVGTLDIGLSYQARQILASVTYFHSRQTDSIITDTSQFPWRYRNLGEVTFQGMEGEGKYYFHKNFLLMGSVSYQANVDGNGNENVTPIPNVGVKAGFSYQTEHGWTASLFDVYAGHLDRRYTGNLNPQPGSYHMVSSHLRWDLSRYLGGGDSPGLALFAYADNLANKQLWLPGWGDNGADTIPVKRGRTIYFGVEFSLRHP